MHLLLTYLNSSGIHVVCGLVFVIFCLRRASWCRRESPQHIPGPPPLPFLGHSLLVFSHRRIVLEFLSKLLNEYGYISQFYIPFIGRNLVIGQAYWLEHIKRNDAVLYERGYTVCRVFADFPGPHTPLGSDGLEWKMSRKMMQPLFGRVFGTSHVSTALTQIVPDILDLFKQASDTKSLLDWNDLSGRIALSLFLNTAFSWPNDLIGPQLESLKYSNHIADCLEVLAYISSNRMLNPIWQITDRLDGSASSFNKARNDMISIVDGLIQDRLRIAQEFSEPQDYLDTLLQDTPAVDTVKIRETLMALLFAGHDTVRNSLLWTVYELTQNPEWIARLRGEISSKGSGNVIPYDQLTDFPLHLAVTYEVQRMWPGISQNYRVARQDDVLPAIPEKGIPAVIVRAGDSILWSDLHLMRSTEVWGPDAAQFNPARFLDEKGEFVKPASPEFATFGYGPRACPGMHIAIYEIVNLLREMTARFDFVPAHPGTRKHMDGFTPFMDGPFWVNVIELK